MDLSAVWAAGRAGGSLQTLPLQIQGEVPGRAPECSYTAGLQLLFLGAFWKVVHTQGGSQGSGACPGPAATLSPAACQQGLGLGRLWAAAGPQVVVTHCPLSLAATESHPSAQPLHGDDGGQPEEAPRRWHPGQPEWGHRAQQRRGDQDHLLGEHGRVATRPAVPLSVCPSLPIPAGHCTLLELRGSRLSRQRTEGQGEGLGTACFCVCCSNQVCFVEEPEDWLPVIFF